MLTVCTLYFTKPRAGDATEGRRDFWRQWGPTYLRRLYAGCTRHLTGAWEFAVITDDADAVTHALPPGAANRLLVVADGEDVPGWWMKLKLFDPAYGLTGPVLYSDLDNVIAGDLTPLLAAAEGEDLVMLDDKVHPGMSNGAAFYCHPEVMRTVWIDYARAPYATRRRFSTWPHASDQAYLAAWHKALHGSEPLHWQDLVAPGMILNSRVELERGADWGDVRLVYGSWDPKPHMSSHPFYATHWVD